jgi:undecaprenyl-diphosphatase
MPLTQVVVLALIQGITELLPISSSAHLAVAPIVFQWPDQGLTFDVALHVGTLLAIVAYFFKDWLDILLHRRRLLGYLILATIPAAVAGAALEHLVETTLRSPVIIGCNAISIALVMWWADSRSSLDRPIDQVTLKDALLIGCAQAVALVPGVSRSGITIITALFRDLKREAAARFSFLLATPIVAGAGLKKALELRQTGIPPEMHIPFLLGMAIAAASGYLVIAFFLRYLQTRTLKIFVYYRLAFGIMVLILAILARPN